MTYHGWRDRGKGDQLVGCGRFVGEKTDDNRCGWIRGSGLSLGRQCECEVLAGCFIEVAQLGVWEV